MSPPPVPNPARPAPTTEAGARDGVAGWAHVAMLDGETKQGRVLRFGPAFPSFLLQIGGRAGQSAITMAVNSAEVSYIAFLRDTTTPTTPPDPSSPTLNVTVVGGRKFQVIADPPTAKAAQGFYGRPPEANGPYWIIYFFNKGVSATEGGGLRASPPDLPAAPARSTTSAMGVPSYRSATPVQGVPIPPSVHTPPPVPMPPPPPQPSSLTQTQTARAAVMEEDAQLQRRKRMRLGEVLIEEGLATQEDIEAALVEQKKHKGKRLGEILVKMELLTEIHLAQVLAKKFNIPMVNLDDLEPTPAALKELPREMIEKYRVLPLYTEEMVITIAISDPMATDGIDAIRFLLRKQVNEVMTTRSQLEEHINRHLNTNGKKDDDNDKVGKILRQMEVKETAPVELKELDDKTLVGESDSAVINLANQIIVDAYRRKVSDIHIEPNGREKSTLVRFRADGDCYDYQEIPAAYRAAVVARLKIMANLDISEKRKPQDGKIKMKLPDATIELRVATIPTVNNNEDMVMRVLASSKPLPLEKLALSPWNYANIKELVKQPYGLVLCVGPTGSGKTTTLHSVLGHINQKDIKIWTAEDPVEITQDRLRQVQVNPKIGFTFAAALRSFLRLDPDVIMIGEMRDEETSSIAVEASLTGHLVMSTLHTNSAPETITRLCDMGVDPFSFADALLGILAQRLARGLCMRCRQQSTAAPDEFRAITKALGEAELARRGITSPETCRMFRAKGCEHCGNSGYAGRVALHELLVANDTLKVAIQRKASVHEMRTIAMEAGMKTLLQDGVEKCLLGSTDLKQVLAVASR